jgi:thiol-disulfide isomerase/thioredoxin
MVKSKSLKSLKNSTTSIINGPLLFPRAFGISGMGISTPGTILRLVGILLLSLVTLYAFFYIFYNSAFPSNMSFKENFDLFNSGGSVDSMNKDKSTKLVYFYMDGCGHCKNFTPTWDKFCSANSSTIKTYKFEQAQVREQINKYGISGFPAVLLLDENNAKIDEYNGERTLEGLTSYVNGHASRS